MEHKASRESLLSTTSSNDMTEAGSLTPNRRSQAELLQQLNAIFEQDGGSSDRSVPLKDLPDLIASFEARRGRGRILMDEEIAALVRSCCCPTHWL